MKYKSIYHLTYSEMKKAQPYLYKWRKLHPNFTDEELLVLITEYEDDMQVVEEYYDKK